MRLPLLAAIFALLMPCLASAFDHAAYLPIELKQVAALNPLNREGRTFHLDAAHTRYRSSVTFSGSIRPLTDDVRSLVRYWRKAMQHPQSFEDLFASEIEVIQGGQSYWMPIQRQLVAPFIEEVEQGGGVTPYVLLLGGIDRTPVFAVSEFEAEMPRKSDPEVETPNRPLEWKSTSCLRHAHQFIIASRGQPVPAPQRQR